jgi:hypothetical protein
MVPKVCRELIEDVKTVTSEVGEIRHRRYARWTVGVLFSVSVPRYQFHTMHANLPNWKPRILCLWEQDNALAMQISALLWVLDHT